MLPVRALRLFSAQAFLYGMPILALLAAKGDLSVWYVVLPSVPIWCTGINAVRQKWRAIPLGPLTLEQSSARARVARAYIELADALQAQNIAFATPKARVARWLLESLRR
jgi:hypothetical protein